MSLQNMEIAKGSAQKKTMYIFDTVIVSNKWMDGSIYISNDYIYISGIIYICILGHTAGSISKPGVGTSWETYWEAIDSSRINNKGSYYSVRTQRDITNDVFTFIVSDGSIDKITKTITPGDEPDDVLTAGKVNFWITEEDSNIDENEYKFELSFVDSSQDLLEQKGVQCCKGTFIVCTNYND